VKKRANMRHALQVGAALVLLATGGAQAQQVFRIVGADGRVTFSDRPAPTTADRSAAASARVVDVPAAPAINTTILPYDLRLAAQRYPVTLYSATGCGACDSARALLRGRGVPFIEKTVGTAADAEAFQRISSSTNVPYATIGAQALQGFSAVEWVQYLDAAGYPSQTELPANYRPPPVSPLVAASPVRTPAAPAAAQPPRGAPSTPSAPAANPAGIQF